VSFQLESNQPVRVLRLNQHLELPAEKREDEIRWIWTAIKLIRNLQSYHDFLDESGFHTKEEHESQKARDQYFKYLYEGRGLENDNEKKARTSLTEQISYGKRWKIFLDTLTPGFLIAYGRIFAMKVM
jgi:hypothetical protein